MRTRCIYLLVALTLSLSVCNSGSSSTTSLTPEVKNLLDNTFSAMIGDNIEQVPGLGVIVFKDGRIVYEHFSGRRELTKNLPLERTTRLRAASVSKMFTVFGIMQLVEAGVIDLDEDASKYLGFTLLNPNFPDEKITVRMLASHTSTLRDGDSYSLARAARLCENYDVDFVGHSGDAYGLISGLYFRPGTKDGVIFMVNGTGVVAGEDARSFGKFSNSYIWEEEIMNPICEHIFTAQ